MEELVFPNELFAPGHVVWNALWIDPARTLADQYMVLDEDLVHVQYRHNVTLDIGWYPALNPDGEFAVMVNDHPKWWKPFIERRCRTIDELRILVAEFIEIARARSLSKKKK